MCTGIGWSKTFRMNKLGIFLHKLLMIFTPLALLLLANVEIKDWEIYGLRTITSFISL